MTTLAKHRGITLVEIVLVVVIGGILVTVAMRSGLDIVETGKVEETTEELDRLAMAIAGNPSLYTNGTRSDFGYAGDVGALPPNLAALVSNPGYATWRGPYVANRYSQIADDYSKDAWGSTYQYTDGVTITSTGSGSDITRRIGSSAATFTSNRLTGTVVDRDGTSPGPVYKSFLNVRLTHPNGAGGMSTRNRTPDSDGSFGFDSIPVGNHDLQVVYAMSADSTTRIVTVLPASEGHVNVSLNANYWSSDTGLTLIPGSDSVGGSPPCTDLSFWLINNTGASVSIASIEVSWPSPAAYYGQVIIGTTTVFDLEGSPRGESGQTYTLSTAYTILTGQTTRVAILDFRENNTNGGGNPVSMSATTLTVRLSDGTSITEVFPACP